MIKKVLVGVVVMLASLVSVADLASAQSGTILAWVAYTDIEEEWANTKRAITMFIPDFEERLIETQEEDPVKLAELLKTASVFLIPEQENEALPSIGRSWQAILSAYVQNGGVVVALDAEGWGPGTTTLIREAGLTTATFVDNDAHVPLEVSIADHPITQDVPKNFIGEDATQWMDNVDGTVLVHKADTHEPVAFTKEIGNGALVMIGMDFFAFNKDMARLLANAIAFQRYSYKCTGSIELEANKLLSSQKIGPKALTETKESQYCIFVAEGAKLLAIKLESKGNLDLHIRQGKPIERSGSAIIADYSLPSPDGNEFLIIFAPQLKKGPHFIAVENKEDTEQEFTLIATPIFDIQELKGPADGSVDPNAGLIPFLRQYLATQGGMLSLTQYKFDVPSGAKSVTVRLEGPAGRNLNLHLRYGKPVEIVADQVAADLSVVGPGGQKGVVLAGTLLKAGRWYIAVESLQAEKVDFKVVVEIQMGAQRIVTALEREPVVKGEGSN